MDVPVEGPASRLAGPAHRTLTGHRDDQRSADRAQIRHLRAQPSATLSGALIAPAFLRS